MRLVIGALGLELPFGFEHEITVVSRAQAQDGYHANVRITAKTVAGEVNLEDLAQEYASRLGEAVGATVETMHSGPRQLDKGQARQLEVRLTLPNGECVVHQVLLALRSGLVLTLATSRHEKDQDAAPTLSAVLDGLRSV